MINIVQPADPTIGTATSGVSSDVDLRHSDFEAFYRHQYPALIAVGTALSGNVEDGEDVVHDTMVRAFVHWARVRRLERPGGWCHRVLTNLCHSRWRRRRTHQRWMALQRRPDAVSDGLSAEVVSFWAIVRTMPERPRTAVALYYGADRSVGDIAAVLGVPDGTVRSDLARARAVLARELGL